MEIRIVKVELEEIRSLRVLFLYENNFQFIYDKCHLYGWADTYIFLMDGIKAGYGSVWGQHKREDRDAIFEFFVIKPYRKHSNIIFQKFNEIACATHIECQSNDPLLSSILYEYTQNINAEAILFEDHYQTNFELPGTTFQRRTLQSEMNINDVQYQLDVNNEIVASGGMMLNYNIPYTDLYYEVTENHRQKGLGTFMLQELKKEAYLIGRVPAARCNINNKISKAALLKAGFKVCGCVLKGTVKIY